MAKEEKAQIVEAKRVILWWRRRWILFRVLIELDSMTIRGDTGKKNTDVDVLRDTGTNKGDGNSEIHKIRQHDHVLIIPKPSHHQLEPHTHILQPGQDTPIYTLPPPETLTVAGGRGSEGDVHLQ